ncbi:CYTH and CHAD domain-containing protein [Cellulomonas sp. URHD0024]|uniref:CYTH and CHAD domain-containing protein n=1 Tax=Cellulomonas sp. URHD0024 TaxID=1302620 RepID=UPI000481467D|nr:CYTH and CHAD domain-containing protein [Cellulomonas sp. URHD0024]
MVEVHREVELKFSVGPGVEVPSLVELAGPTNDGQRLTQGEPEHHVLRATYYDTADLGLARHHLTLRRRVGGKDAGWHLKLPGEGSERAEVRLPAGRAGGAVPQRLQRLVRARTHGDPLVPVATITTERTVHQLFDATDRALLELADDRVAARRVLPLGGSGDARGPEVAWREIEIEVLDGGEEVLAPVAAQLGARGLTVAPHTSKIARVLQVDEVTPDADRTRGPRRSAKSSTSDVALAYVGDQLEQLRAQDILVRMGAPGSVHKMRVATRRLRSALATFRPSFGPEVVGPLRDELKWLAGILGEVRDAEVMRERVLGVLQDGSAHVRLSSDPSEAEAEAQLGSAYAAARDALLLELDGQRYDQLLDALETFMHAPPVTKRGRRPARKELRRGVAHEYAGVRRLVKQAAAATGSQERAELLHDARKAAKRTRYAAELASDAFGSDARAFAAAMESTQELLGQHQDSVVLRERLRELAETTTDPSAAFTYGRLHALEEARGRETEEQLPAVWARASRKRLRRWLR